MKRVDVSVPAFEFAVITRALFGLGAGLLLADRLPRDRRKAIGLSLVAIGAASTIPAFVAFRRGIRDVK